ncbi:hypothetical protein TWF481_000666 [Arthrobotrys musiformis]|uniref:Uncharacterized protein n=1 Tax=Arthrobotrys musiformis TaxID=47236 RepID=A0AAV9WQJ0_9PEZI
MATHTGRTKQAWQPWMGRPWRCYLAYNALSTIYNGSCEPYGVPGFFDAVCVGCVGVPEIYPPAELAPDLGITILRNVGIIHPELGAEYTGGEFEGIR